MKQVLQNLKNGNTEIADVPMPMPKRGTALIKTSRSLISMGTEKMLVDFGKSNLIDKARSQPEKVKMVLDKVKSDGVMSTVEAVLSKLDQPMALGYCNVGKIVDPTDTGFSTGDRVISNGSHAEIVRVSKNLIAKIPQNVDDDTASFTVMGAIALQGIRLLKPNIGESVAVIGLGIIGLLSVQILKANGCRVIAADFNENRCKIAKGYGAKVINLSSEHDFIENALAFSDSNGVDGVLITASTKSNDVIHQAAKISRKRGKIILVGVIGLELKRDDFYEKELSFQVSCSYGPGRYDHAYEDKGIDYPYPYVRWTEKRNFDAILELMASGKIKTENLITHSFDIDNASQAYEGINSNSSLGIIIKYDNLIENINSQKIKLNNDSSMPGNNTISFIGGGNYASRVLIPGFLKAGASLNTIVTSGGISASHFGRKNRFKFASTNIEDAFNDESDTVVIATGHNLHASQVIKALNMKKNVFVEKPLSLTHDDINKIIKAQKDSGKSLMVGYNRRFAPLTKKIKNLLAKKSVPKTFIFTMNPGHIPSSHWTQDENIGGGRILGEACHYIDLMRFLADSKIVSYQSSKIGNSDFHEISEDKASITLNFEDGSMGTIHYFSNGHSSFPKERLEIFCDGSILHLDNFKTLRGYGWKGFSKKSLIYQDKGQKNCIKEFLSSIMHGTEMPIPLDEIYEVANITVEIAESLRTN